MRRALLVLVIVLLLLSLAGNVALLWVYGSTVPTVQRLQEDVDRQSEELAQLQRERDRLDGQVRTLEAEKNRLEDEKVRLEEELSAYRGQQDALEQLDRLEADARAVRRLVPPEMVERRFISPEELRIYLEEHFADEYSEEQAAAETQVLTLLGLLDPGADLYHLLLDLYTEQVLGFYDLEQDLLFVVGEGDLEALERITFVHEYVHALHDQLFDLGMQVDALADDSDRLLALEALAEGDATLAMQQYMLAHLDELLSVEFLSQTLLADSSRFNAAPEVVREQLLFPYEAGLSFVLSLYAGRGWMGVDAAWGNPPQSTEQILHPERYPDDAPQVVSMPALTSTLGAGWRFRGENTLGEFVLRQHLTLYLDAEDVDQAATGWGGDRYALYVQPEQGAACLVMRLLWDDEDEAAEFAEAYERYAEARYGGPGEGELEEGVWWIGRPGLYLQQREDEVWLVLSPDLAVAQQIAERLR